MTVANASRQVVLRVYVKWDGTSWTEESARVISARGDMRVAPPGESLFASKGFSSEVTITLANEAGRYSVNNASSPIYANISGGGAYKKPCYVTIEIDGGGEETVFDGFVKMPKETGRSVNGVGVVELVCRSAEDLIMQSSLSTTTTNFAQIYEEHWNEEEIIAYVLTQAGLTDGTDFRSQAWVAANGGTATLDPGLIIIPWFWLDEESPIDECWSIAAACGGRFYADAASKLFYYENAQNYLTNTRSNSTQWTLNWDMFEEITLNYDDKELYDSVKVTASPRHIAPLDVVWTPDEPIRCPGNRTITVTANLSQPVYEYSGLSYTGVSAGGLTVSSGLTVTPTYYAQRVELSITNTNTYTLYLRQFQIQGRPVVGSPSIERVATSADGFWATLEGRTRNVSSNPYIQTTLQADFLCNLLLNRQQHPMMLVKASGLVADPAMKPGDKVLIENNEFGAAITGIISDYSWRYVYGSYNASFTAFSDEQLYEYGNPNEYFIIGTHALNTTKVMFL